MPVGVRRQGGRQLLVQLVEVGAPQGQVGIPARSARRGRRVAPLLDGHAQGHQVATLPHQDAPVLDGLRGLGPNRGPTSAAAGAGLAGVVGPGEGVS